MGRLHTCYSPVRRSPAVKSKLSTPLPLDLHVLSLSLAFILSQDQTLRCFLSCFFFFYLNKKARLFCKCLPKATSEAWYCAADEPLLLRSTFEIDRVKNPVFALVLLSSIVKLSMCDAFLALRRKRWQSYGQFLNWPNFFEKKFNFLSFFQFSALRSRKRVQS